MLFDTITLNDKNKLPAIAFGTGSKWKDQDVSTITSLAIETGFTHIDTAQYYGNEEGVGQAIRESGLARDELFITTKYGHGQIRKSLTDSLTSLGLKYLDLYLIHSPNLVPNRDLEGAWREFEIIKEQGLARSIGVSNFTLEDLQRIVKSGKVLPAVNQIQFHPYNYLKEHKSLLEYSAKHGIVTAAYSSLTPITRYPNGPVDVPVAAAAKRIGATPTQVILKWVRSKGIAIVTTSSTKAHLEEYLAAEDYPALTAEEINAIDEAGADGPPSSLIVWKTPIKAVLLLMISLVLFTRSAGYWNW